MSEPEAVPIRLGGRPPKSHTTYIARQRARLAVRWVALARRLVAHLETAPVDRDWMKGFADLSDRVGVPRRIEQSSTNANVNIEARAPLTREEYLAIYEAVQSVSREKVEPDDPPYEALPEPAARVATDVPFEEPPQVPVESRPKPLSAETALPDEHGVRPPLSLRELSRLVERGILPPNEPPSGWGRREF